MSILYRNYQNMSYVKTFHCGLLITFSFLNTLSSPTFSPHLKPFPLKEFLKVSDPEYIRKYTLSNLCYTSTYDARKYVKQCSCTKWCMLFHECCIDALWVSGTNFTDITTYIEHFLREAAKYKKQECREIVPSAERFGHKSKAYYMRTRCPEEANVWEKHMCSILDRSSQSTVPVLGSDQYMYRNTYCASCNRVDHFRMMKIEGSTLHKPHWKSDKYGKQRFTSEPLNCTLELRLHGYTGRHGIITRECKKTKMKCPHGNQYRELCDAFKGTVFSKDGIRSSYWNHYCYLCEHGKEGSLPSVTVKRLSCGPSGCPWVGAIAYWQVPSLVETSSQSFKQCTNETLILRLLGECVPFVCPHGYGAYNAKCVRSNQSYELFKFTNSSFDDCLMRQAERLFIFNVTAPLIKAKEIHDSVNILKTINVSFDQRTVLVEMGKMKNISVRQLLLSQLLSVSDKLDKNETIIMRSYEDVSHLRNKSVPHMSYIYHGNRQCAKMTLLEENVTSTCDVLHNGGNLESKDLLYWLEVKRNSSRRFIYYCSAFYLSSGCPLGSLRTIESNITLDENLTITYSNEGTRIMYGIDDYVPLGDGNYKICIKSMHSNRLYPYWCKTVDYFIRCVALVATSLSAAFYIMIISTFVVFKDLRSSLGLCILALYICLVIGDGIALTIIILEDMHIKLQILTCEMLGVIMHFFMLAVHFWCLMLAIDVSRRMQSIVDNVGRRRSFRVYCIVSFTTSLMIVLVASVLRAGGLLQIRYENNGKCMLHGFHARIIFYFIPMVISFTTSMLLIFKTIRQTSMDRTQNGSASSTGSTNRSISANSPFRRQNNHKGRQSCKSRSISTSDLTVTTSQGRITDQGPRSTATHQRYRTSVAKTALKLLIICGLSECIGYINIPKLNLNNLKLIFNIIFQFTYLIVRSFRGVVLSVLLVSSSEMKSFYRHKFKNHKLFIGRAKKVSYENHAIESNAAEEDTAC